MSLRRTSLTAETLLESARGPAAVLDPRFQIVAANRAYAEVTQTPHEVLIGQKIFALLPRYTADPASTGVRKLTQSLQRVARRCVTDTVPVRQYEIRSGWPQGGRLEKRYWSVFNSPVFDSQGKLAYIVHRIEDVSDFVQRTTTSAEHARLQKELREESERTRREYARRAGEVLSANFRLTRANDEIKRLYEQSRTQAERSLWELNEQLRTFIEYSPVALAMFDRKMRYLQASRRWRDDYQLGEQNLVGRSHYDIVPNSPKRWREARRRALAGEVVRVEEDRFEKPDGAVQWLRWEVRPWYEGADSIGGIVIFTEDISERKRVVDALAERNALLDTVSETAPIGLGFVDTDFRVVRFNRTMAEFAGLTPEACIGRTVADIAPDLWGTLAPLYKRALAGKSVVDREISGLVKANSGRCGYWRVSYYPVRVGKKIIGVGIVAADITETKRNEDALRESEARFRQLVHALPAAVYTCDVKGRLLIYNAAAVKLWGREPDRQRDRWCGSYRIYDGEGRPLKRRQLAVAQATREDRAIKGLERIIERPDGSRSCVLAFPDPLHDGTGRVTGAVNILFDITALKETENALRTTERKLRTLSRAVEQSPASVLITDPSGEIEYVNPTFTEVTGYKLEEVLGKNPRILKSGHQSPEFYRNLWETIKAGRDWRGEFCNRKKNGEEMWEFAVIAPIHEADGTITHFVAIKEDITQRRRALEALHDREERLRAILNTVMDAVITIDRQGRIVRVNRATELMFGYTEAELLAQNLRILLPSTYHEEHEHDVDHYLHHGTSKFGDGRELQARRKDGRIFFIELAMTELRYLSLFTCVLHDITERRKLESEVLRIGEDERQRVAADLHDGICQELMGISFVASAVQRELQEANPKLAAKVKALSEAISQAAGHTRAVARGMTPVVADKNGLMLTLRQLAMNTAQGHRIRCTFECPAPVIINDTVTANQLYRVAQEALQNAIRHGAASRITIKLSEIDGGICLRIRDNGRGLSAKTGPDAGMGLRTMRYRTALIGGQLSLRSRPCGGAEVLVRLPQNSPHL